MTLCQAVAKRVNKFAVQVGAEFGNSTRDNERHHERKE